MKVFAERKLNMAHMIGFVLDRVENIMGKVEKVGFQYFFTFPQSLCPNLSMQRHIVFGPSLCPSVCLSAKPFALPNQTPLVRSNTLQAMGCKDLFNLNIISIKVKHLQVKVNNSKGHFRKTNHFHEIQDCHLQTLLVWMGLRFVVW